MSKPEREKYWNMRSGRRLRFTKWMPSMLFSGVSVYRTWPEGRETSNGLPATASTPSSCARTTAASMSRARRARVMAVVIFLIES